LPEAVELSGDVADGEDRSHDDRPHTMIKYPVDGGGEEEGPRMSSTAQP
jgi:hypothetical protein